MVEMAEDSVVAEDSAVGKEEVMGEVGMAEMAEDSEEGMGQPRNF